MSCEFGGRARCRFRLAKFSMLNVSFIFLSLFVIRFVKFDDSEAIAAFRCEKKIIIINRGKFSPSRFSNALE